MNCIICSITFETQKAFVKHTKKVHFGGNDSENSDEFSDNDSKESNLFTLADFDKITRIMTANKIAEEQTSSNHVKQCNMQENISVKSTVQKKRRKRGKVLFGKKFRPKHKSSVQEDKAHYSGDNKIRGLMKKDSIQKRSVKEDNSYNVNSQLSPVQLNLLPNSTNHVYTAKPNVTGNRISQPPVSVKSDAASQNIKIFDFNSENILQWLKEHKEICKGLLYPLPQRLYNIINSLHKQIYENFTVISIKCSYKDRIAIMKVYEELDCMKLKHLNSISDVL